MFQGSGRESAGFPAISRLCRPQFRCGWGSGFRVQGSGFRVQGLGFRV